MTPNQAENLLSLESKKTNIEAMQKRIKRWTFFFAAFWTMILLFSYYWNQYEKQKETIENAKLIATSAFDKNMLYHHWSSEYQGLFVPISETVKPNQYLKSPDRVVELANGAKLAKITPARMLREVGDMEAERTGVKSHITSLNPLRPGNAPDEWEHSALKRFEKGESVVEGIHEEQRGDAYRIMKPFYIEESCMPCHAEQGYTLGDVRGGIRISVPLKPLRALADNYTTFLLLGHSAFWLLGLFLLGFGSRELLKNTRKQAEAQSEIEKKNGFLRSTMDSLAYPFLVIDASDYSVVMANDKAKGVTGAIWGKCHQMTHNSDAPCNSSEHPCPVAEVKKTKKPVMVDHIHYNEKGERIPVEVHGYPIFDEQGEVRQVIEYSIDVSKQRKALDAIRQSEERFRSLIQNAPVGILTMKPGGEIIDVNQMMLDIVGSPGRDFSLSLNLFEIKPLKESKILEDLRQAIETGKQTTGESPYVSLYGKESYLRYSITPIRTMEETSSMLLLMVENIIHQKKAEREKTELEDRIMQTQKMESLGVLAGGLAHDFNNLLVSILGNASLMLEDLPPESEYYEDILSIETSAQRAADLAQQMLAYSGKGRFVIEDVDLGTLIRNMTEFAESTVSKKISIEFDIQASLSLIKGDVSQIKQLLVSLITNASEAIGEEPGIIRLSAGQTFCDDECLKKTYMLNDLEQGNYHYLEISDTGVGMDEETLEKLFDPFFSTKFIGRGLGMAAVIGIVRSHKGGIRVDSELGEGTTIRIYLPSPKADEKPEKPSQPIEQWQGEGTVFVIDDEDAVRGVANKILERMGFDVMLAANGKDGVRIFKDQHAEIKLVFLDMTMPDMSGEETFDALAQIDPEVKVAVISGHSEEMVRERFGHRPIVGFIAKPFRVDKLKEQIRRLLE